MTLYKGELKVVSGELTANELNPIWVTVPVIQVGDALIENAVVSTAMYSILKPGQLCALRVGRFLWRPLLLRVSYEGEAYGIATLTFLAINLMHAMPIGLALAILFSIPWGGRAGQGLWLACTAVAFTPNLRRWL